MPLAIDCFVSSSLLERRNRCFRHIDFSFHFPLFGLLISPLHADYFGALIQETLLSSGFDPWIPSRSQSATSAEVIILSIYRSFVFKSKLLSSTIHALRKNINKIDINFTLCIASDKFRRTFASSDFTIFFGEVSSFFFS